MSGPRARHGTPSRRSDVIGMKSRACACCGYHTLSSPSGETFRNPTPEDHRAVGWEPLCAITEDSDLAPISRAFFRVIRSRWRSCSRSLRSRSSVNCRSSTRRRFLGTLPRCGFRPTLTETKSSSQWTVHTATEALGTILMNRTTTSRHRSISSTRSFATRLSHARSGTQARSDVSKISSRNRTGAASTAFDPGVELVTSIEGLWMTASVSSRPGRDRS